MSVDDEDGLATGESAPAMGAPVPRQSRRKVLLAALAAGAAVVLLVVGYTAVRHLIDAGSYDDGHEAYVRADCAAAIGEFDTVINSWRIATLGGTVQRAEAEKAECLVFQEAADHQQVGNQAAAVAAYGRFISGRPASPLTDAARTRIADLLGQPDLNPLATLESCDTLQILRDEKLLIPPAAPRFYAACGAVYKEEVQLGKSVDAYASLFTDYGNDKAATDAEAKLSADPSWCISLDRVRAHPVLSAHGDLFPGLLATCTVAPGTEEALARKNAEEFLQKFPGHSRAAEVVGTLARLLIKVVRETGVPADIGPADIERIVGGDKAVLVISNDTNEPLRIAISGPESKVEAIGACPNCPDRTEKNASCRDQAVSKRIVLARGEFELADVPPEPSETAGVFAHWTLQAGKEYSLCSHRIVES